MSWKKYGGIKNLENFNNMTLNNIVTDTFTVRDAIINLLRIEGDLLVNGKIDVRNDVIIRGNIVVDSIFGANLVTFDTARIKEGHISGNLFVQGNIYFDPARDTFIYGKNYNFGINIRTPTAALDISSIYNENINMWTTQPINKNVLSRNNQDKGIVFITDNYGASVEFFNETKIPVSANNVTFQDNNYVADASMSYHKGGILDLHTTNDVKISTNLIVNKKSNKGHLLQEPAVIYDIPAGTYFYNSYQQSTVKTGNALTLISNDNYSNTFLNITTPNKQGAAFGGGMYPYDVSRNMAIIGVLDASGALTPHQIIVSGNSSVRAKSTVGFNTFAPITETYVVNINGPTRITNGEITTIVEPYIQVYNIGYPKNKLYQNQICVVGTPYPDPTNLTNNLYYIWNSTTGGTTWTQPVLKNINGSPIFGSTVNIIFYGSTVYNNNFILMSGTSDTILFSTNGGANWRIVTGISRGSTFYSVSVIYYNSTQQLFFAAYDGSFLYFYADVTNSNSFTNVTSSVSISTGISGIGTSCDTAGGYFYIAGSKTTGGGATIKQYLILSLSSASQHRYAANTRRIFLISSARSRMWREETSSARPRRSARKLTKTLAGSPTKRRSKHLRNYSANNMDVTNEQLSEKLDLHVKTHDADFVALKGMWWKFGITVLVQIVTGIFAYGTLTANVANLKEELDKKANKETVENQLASINASLARIEGTLTVLNTKK